MARHSPALTPQGDLLRGEVGGAFRLRVSEGFTTFS